MVESMVVVLMSLRVVNSFYIASGKLTVSRVTLGLYCWIHNV